MQLMAVSAGGMSSDDVSAATPHLLQCQQRVSVQQLRRRAAARHCWRPSSSRRRHHNGPRPPRHPAAADDDDDDACRGRHSSATAAAVPSPCRRRVTVSDAGRRVRRKYLRRCRPACSERRQRGAASERLRLEREYDRLRRIVPALSRRPRRPPASKVLASGTGTTRRILVKYCFYTRSFLNSPRHSDSGIFPEAISWKS